MAKAKITSRKRLGQVVHESREATRPDATTPADEKTAKKNTAAYLEAHLDEYLPEMIWRVVNEVHAGVDNASGRRLMAIARGDQMELAFGVHADPPIWVPIGTDAPIPLGDLTYETATNAILHGADKAAAANRRWVLRHDLYKQVRDALATDPTKRAREIIKKPEGPSPLPDDEEIDTEEYT